MVFASTRSGARFGSVLVVALLVLAAAPAATAQSGGAQTTTVQPALTVAAGGTTPTLTFNKANDQGRTARLNLVLNVPKGKSGHLAVSFLPTGPDSSGKT